MIRVFIAALLAVVGFVPIARAQSTVQQVADIVFTQAEKRILHEVLGGGRYEATSDGHYHKVARDGRYDDLAHGTDGKFYGKHGDRDEEREGNGKGHAKKHGRGNGLPPGLAKKGKLPPGLDKQLKRNGRLPPGLMKNPLPYEAASHLPPPPQGTERVIVGSSVVLLERATNRILDVLTDVLTRG